ncbi:Na(+)/H(+) antiporter NhaA [Picochlorum sp. SENEW3]|nr:Na(+)/H(+) antiporter NhaA [Picochlorum sp. SENEW3]
MSSSSSSAAKGASRLARWWLLGRNRMNDPVVNVLKLNGVITPPSRSPGQGRRGINADSLEKYLQNAFSKTLNPSAVAISINSPGGSPGQSEAVYLRIRELSKESGIPVYTFAEDVAASGGYWILCAGDKIFAQYKTSIVGSIGVISSSFGVSRLASSWGIERRVWTAGKAKLSAMDPFLDYTEDQEKRLKSILEDMHTNFIEAVKESRGDALIDDEDELFSGKIWTGSQAAKVGIVDGTGTLSSTMKDMFGENVKLRAMNRPGSEFGLRDLLSPAFGSSRAAVDDALMMHIPSIPKILV